jgi:hypothetical protein
MKITIIIITLAFAALTVGAPADVIKLTGDKEVHVSAGPGRIHYTVTSNKPRAAAMPFSGKVKAVDTSAKTFTLAGKQAARVFAVTNQTKITKGEEVFKIEDIKVGDTLTGTYKQSGQNTPCAVSVKLCMADDRKAATKDGNNAANPDVKPAK